MKLISAFAVILLSFADLSHAVEGQPIILQAAQADYNGKEILLKGDVTLEHDLGTIFSDNVTLMQAPTDKNMSFSYIKMQDRVRLDFRDGAQLRCERAYLNYQDMTGSFFGEGKQPFVSYSDNCYEKNNLSGSFIVQSRQMKVNISKQASTGSQITDIVAERDVTVGYQQNFQATADKAIYHRSQSSAGIKSHKQNLEGIIHLESNGDQGYCKVTNSNGDSIFAREISIDTAARNLAFIFPQGKIHVTRDAANIEQLDFSADTMTWDERKDILTLRDHVILEQNGFGRLIGDKEIKIFQTSIEGKKQLQRVQAEGQTILTYLDAGRMLHTLTSYGRLLADHIRGRTMIEAPRDSQGRFIEGRQVHFQDALGMIDGDKVTLIYDMRDQNLIPKKFIIEGHVHIRNQFAADPDTNVLPLQYALADVVEYIPETKEMLLASRENPRVLFFDKVNNIQVSAPSLRVKRDPLTQKESIQGTGDVRFTFVERELEQLKKEFGIE